jgi:hypothetical protein
MCAEAVARLHCGPERFNRPVTFRFGSDGRKRASPLGAGSRELPRLQRAEATPAGIPLYDSGMIRVLKLLLLCGVSAAIAQDGGLRRITRQQLEDKIRGGWAGQMIGVSFGAPTEFRSNGKIIEGRLPWTPRRVTNSIDQDDLYVEMTFSEVFDKYGLEATSEQFGEAFRTSKYNLWHANAAARRLLNLGLKPPATGHPKYNSHSNDIDFQIEADFIGLMTPGMMQEAVRYADRIGRVMNSGDGLYGGIYVACLYASAYFEDDPHKVVEQALECIPAQSGYAKIVRDLLEQHRRDPRNWRAGWQMLTEKWDKNDSCPDGAGRPFNIDARLNGAFIVLGLLYGDREFGKTIEISTRAGQDSDCNPSSAGGVLGAMLGYSRIPETWKSGIAAIADSKFAYTQSTFNSISAGSVARALEIVKRAGGRVTADTVEIPRQRVTPPALEQWEMGTLAATLDTLETAWSWKGEWQEEHFWDNDGVSARKKTAVAGAEATLTFQGYRGAADRQPDAGWRTG